MDLLCNYAGGKTRLLTYWAPNQPLYLMTGCMAFKVGMPCSSGLPDLLSVVNFMSNFSRLEPPVAVEGKAGEQR